jgi:hypothetical protein
LHDAISTTIARTVKKTMVSAVSATVRGQLRTLLR